MVMKKKNSRPAFFAAMMSTMDHPQCEVKRMVTLFRSRMVLWTTNKKRFRGVWSGKVEETENLPLPGIHPLSLSKQWKGGKGGQGEDRGQWQP